MTINHIVIISVKNKVYFFDIIKLKIGGEYLMAEPLAAIYTDFQYKSPEEINKITEEKKASAEKILNDPSFKEDPYVKEVLGLDEVGLVGEHMKGIVDATRAVFKHFGLKNAQEKEPEAFAKLGIVATVMNSRGLSIVPPTSSNTGLSQQGK